MLLKQCASTKSLGFIFDNQIASSLLTTCSRLVIIKPEQAMRTHPDIGLMAERQQDLTALLELACSFDLADT